MGRKCQKSNEGASTSPLTINREYKNFRRLEEIEVWGDKMDNKKKDYVRVYFENVQGLPISRGRLYKYNKLNRLIRRLGIDIVGGAEANVNWDMNKEKFNIHSCLNDENGLRVITGHNTHEHFGARQYGGTFTGGIGDICNYIKDSGKDKRGLGRWTWLNIKGNEERNTAIITAYEPVRSGKKNINSVYNQQRRYFKRRQIETCPKKMFRSDLIDLLKDMKGKNQDIVLMIDSNENMFSGKLAKMLRELNLKDAVFERTQKEGPATSARGSKQIDGVWMSSHMKIDAARILPLFFGVGDHRGFIIDISFQDMIGAERIKIVQAKTRRLQCNTAYIKNKYIKEMEKYCGKHNLLARARWLKINSKLDPDATWLHVAETTDKLITEGMIHSEKICCKLKKDLIPFSPEVNQTGMTLAC